MKNVLKELKKEEEYIVDYVCERGYRERIEVTASSVRECRIAFKTMFPDCDLRRIWSVASDVDECGQTQTKA